ncbi:MAG: matrixin [Alphaproteobacteria bacterium]|nr:matrixin [Alphaproteobacteria bacterium]
MGIQIGPSNIQDIDGILWGWCWQWNNGDHAVLTYSFPTSRQVYLDQGYADVQGFQAFNAKQKAAAEKVLANYDAVCNLDFVFTADPYQGNIRFAEASYFDDGNGFQNVNDTAFGFAPDNAIIAPWTQGDTWYNNPDAAPGENYNSPIPGNHAYTAGLLHEVGHAVGLKHGHEGQPVFNLDLSVAYTNPALPANHDSQEYSVMTYRAYPGAALAITPEEYPSTLMQDDILALQYLYGANYDHNDGNTTYKWNPKTGAMSINGQSQGETYHGKIFLTVWDGGGVDTYDFSNYDTNATIRLDPGAWSTPSNAQRADLHLGAQEHLARGCIANARYWEGDLRPLIENAIGGSGNDKITGNQVDNKLTGGRGSDTLTGKSGNDRFDFNSIKDSAVGGKRDVITDFKRGQDLIDLKGIDAKTGSNDQKFTWIGKQGFHDEKGELRLIDKGASCIVQGDVDGDGKADFEILVKVGLLGASDFLL